MAPPFSPEPPHNGLRPDQTSGLRDVLTDSAPVSREATAQRLVQMPPTAAQDNLAYTAALVAACQRMWAAPDLAILWRRVVDEGLALIPADGAAVVTSTERFWQVLAVGPDGTAPDDARVASGIELLFRRDLLRQQISIDDLAEVASSDGQVWRALLVMRIEVSTRQPVRLIWYATRPATLRAYADKAEAFAHHASLALKAVTERDNLNRAVAARHRVGLAQGILMSRHQITAEQAFTLLRLQSQNTHVKLRTIARTVIQTGDLPANGNSKAR
jgi:ANTAR domain-containing protein